MRYVDTAKLLRLLQRPNRKPPLFSIVINSTVQFSSNKISRRKFNRIGEYENSSFTPVCGYSGNDTSESRTVMRGRIWWSFHVQYFGRHVVSPLVQLHQNHRYQLSYPNWVTVQSFAVLCEKHFQTDVICNSRVHFYTAEHNWICPRTKPSSRDFNGTARNRINCSFR